MTLIVTSILAGTWGLTAAIMVVYLLRIELKIQPYIINSMAILLLFGSSMYLLKTGVEFIDLLKSGQKGYFRSIPFFTIFFAWPFTFGVLPQLLWIKQFRQQLASLVAFAAVWTITVFFVPWSNTAFSYINFVEMVVIYAAALLIIYRLSITSVKRTIKERANTTRIKKYAESY